MTDKRFSLLISGFICLLFSNGVRAEFPLFQGELDITSYTILETNVSYRITGEYTDRSVAGFSGLDFETNDFIAVETPDGSGDMYVVTNVVSSDFIDVTLEVEYQPSGSTSTVGMVVGVAAVARLSTNNAGFLMQPSLTGARISEHLANAIRNFNLRRIMDSDLTGYYVQTNDTRQLDWTEADIRIADSSETNNPVTRAELDAHAGAGTITNLISTDGSVDITDSDGPQPDLSVTGYVAGVVAGYVPTNDADYLSIARTMTNWVHVPSSTNWLYYDPSTRLLRGCVTNDADEGATNIVAGATDSYDAGTRTLTWNTNAVGGGVADLSGWSGYPATQLVERVYGASGGTVDAGAYEFDSDAVAFSMPDCSGTNYYVSLDGGHVSPYTNWNDASTNILTVLHLIDAAYSADHYIWLSNGVYAITSSLASYGGASERPWLISKTGNPKDVEIKGDGSFIVLNSFDLSQPIYAVGITISGGTTGSWENVLYNCILTNNTVGIGGVAGGSAYNCLVTGNDVGVHWAEYLYNCTVAGNTSTGVWNTSTRNCVSWGNGGPDSGDAIPQFSIGDSAIYTNTTCSTNDPLLTADYQLSEGSPAIGFGTNYSWMTDAAEPHSRDLSGNRRIELVDSTNRFGIDTDGIFKVVESGETKVPVYTNDATYTDTVAKAASALQEQTYGETDSTAYRGDWGAAVSNTAASALQEQSYGTTDSTAYRGDWGASVSNLAAAALSTNGGTMGGTINMSGNDITNAGTVTTTNLTIKGGSPTAGAVWRSTGTDGAGEWSTNTPGWILTHGPTVCESGTTTLIGFTNVVETNSVLVSSSGEVTPQVAGYYTVSAYIQVNQIVNDVDPTFSLIRIYKNDSIESMSTIVGMVDSSWGNIEYQTSSSRIYVNGETDAISVKFSHYFFFNSTNVNNGGRFAGSYIGK